MKGMGMMNHHFKAGLLKNADSHAQVQAIIELVEAHSQRFALNRVKTPELPAGHRHFFDAGRNVGTAGMGEAAKR